ncbi:MAG: replication protein, partial [Candidatus Woesearchaeota archaeon]
MKITYQSQIFQTIKSFAGEKNILAIPKSFIRFCDENLYTGLFLSQIIYLSDKGNRDDGYIYKSNKEWKEDYFLSDYAIRKAKNYLEEKGIIDTKLIKANGAPTTHYKLNKEKFAELFMEFLKNKEDASNGFVEINDSSDSMDSS